jgi:hypothetical protein
VRFGLAAVTVLYSVPMRRHYHNNTPLNIIRTLDEGNNSRQDMARIFQVPYATVCAIYKRFNDDGVVEKNHAVEIGHESLPTVPRILLSCE